MNRHLIIIIILFSLVYNGYSQNYLAPISKSGIQHYIKLFNGREEATVVQYVTSTRWYTPYYGFRIAKDNNLYETINQKRRYLNPQFAITIQKLFLAATDTMTTNRRLFPCDGGTSIFIVNGEDKILRAGAIGCPRDDIEVLVNICNKIFKIIEDGKEEDQALQKDIEILIEKLNARK